MIDGSCLRNGNHRVLGNAPVQCHLGFRLTRHRCHVGEDVFRISQFDVGQPLGQRTIGDYGDTVFLAVAQERWLDAPFHQTVTNLVGNDLVFGQSRLCSFELRHREVAHPNEPDLALLHQLFHGCHSLLDRHGVIRPVELVEIDVISPQTLEAALSR